MQTASAKTEGIIIIRGAVIEFDYREDNSIQCIKVHQPIGLSCEAVNEIHEEIDRHLSSDYHLIQDGYSIIGRVHVKKWKVIYE